MAGDKLCHVVNLYKEPYDVYIGRGPDPKTGRYQTPSFGNPFVVGQSYKGQLIDRDLACDLYEEALLYSEEEGWEILRLRVRELAGKILGCYCKPKRCHGDTIAKLANQYANQHTR